MSGQLDAALTQQVENLSQLVLLLEKELHLISSRDAETLFTLLEDKTALLSSIQALDNDIEPLYKKNKETDTLSDSSAALMEKAASLLDACKYRTEINQKAVEQGQLRLTHLRNLMLEVRAKESLTYDKKGKPNAGRLGSGIRA